MNTRYEILIADDNTENLKLLSSLLNGEGYHVRIAKDGLQALESFKASEPDLLILDVQMPKMDGFEVAKKIKQEVKPEGVSIIFLSALGDNFNISQAYKAGADDYIKKPFFRDEILMSIKNQLRYHDAVKRNRKLEAILKEHGIPYEIE